MASADLTLSVNWAALRTHAAEKLKKHVLITVVVLLGGLAYAAWASKRYEAEAVIVIPQQNQSVAANLLSQLGGMAGIAGGLVGKNTADMYLSMLKSRSVLSSVVKNMDLKSVFEKESSAEAEEELKKRVLIESGKDGLIRISYRDVDGARAASVVNELVQQLSLLIGRMNANEADQRLKFLDGQRHELTNRLEKAEVELRRFQEDNAIVTIDATARLQVEKVAQIEAQISMLSAKAEAMLNRQTPSSQEYKALTSELAALKRQRDVIDRSMKPADGESTLPSKGLQYMRLIRLVKYHEALFEVLSRQYEMASIDAKNSIGVLQIVDEAVVPELHVWPKPVPVLVAALLLAFVLNGCLFIRGALQRGIIRLERVAALEA